MERAEPAYFNEIVDSLRRALPEGASIAEVYSQCAVWRDRDGRRWRQPYSRMFGWSGERQELVGDPVARREATLPVEPLLELAERWRKRGRAAFVSAGRQPEGEEFGRRFIEHGGTCYLNCAIELMEALGRPGLGLDLTLTQAMHRVVQAMSQPEA